MKIKQLDVKGFRSLKDVSWQPDDLNVVIGQNGTGKSNLLRMLELICASAQGRLSKYIQAAGGMEPILWDGIAPSITFHLKMDNSFETQNVPNDYEVELARLGATSWYQVKREILTDGASTNYIERNGDDKAALGGINTAWVGSSGPSAQETLLSLVTPSLTSKPPLQYMQTVWFREKLAEISVYHDLNVGQDSKIRQAPVARFEKRVEPDGQNLVTVLHTLYTGDREFESNREEFPASVKNPESVNFNEPPARLLERLYQKILGKRYKKKVGGRKLFSNLDPEVAYQKCPRLREMLDEMLKLAKESGN